MDLWAVFPWPPVHPNFEIFKKFNFFIYPIAHKNKMPNEFMGSSSLAGWPP
jgi:hypothetical protein